MYVKFLRLLQKEVNDESMEITPLNSQFTGRAYRSFDELILLPADGEYLDDEMIKKW